MAQPDEAHRATDGVTRIGRHVVIEKLGAGGMGIVLAAYDPELDRKIAIKVLRAPGEKASAALLREAKAMARVSHPNVIAVFDVGTQDGSVYLAMEFVQGRTMRAWLRAQQRPLPWREVLRVLVPAGRGLAAAHAAGLVHGDFKPDNVMIGDDGSVRVMDFGLARPGRLHTTTPYGQPSGADAEATQGTYGTPAYMAPEQFRLEHADELSDQFSFCVALFEALFGQRPFPGATLAELGENVTAGRVHVPTRNADVPGWLTDVVLRGLQPAREDRWPTMGDLLAALHADPTRRRRLLALLAAGALLAVGATTGWWVHRRGLVKSCEESGDAIHETWGDAQRVAFAAALEQSGTANPAQIHETTVPWLDRFADAWAQSRTRACLAGRVEATVDDEAYAAIRDCHDDLHADFATRVEMLLAVDQPLAQRAVTLASSIAPVDGCNDARALLSRPVAPEDDRVHQTRRRLIEASAHHAAGRYDAGKKLAGAALVEAEAIGWPPLVAEAKSQLGELLESAGDYEEAERVLREAALLAAEIQHDTVAADASTRLTQLIGERKAEFALGEHWAAWARVYLARLDDTDGLRGAALHNALGSVYTAAGRFEDAAAELEQSLAAIEGVLGEDHPETAAPLNNLAIVLREVGDLERAEAVHRRELALGIETLGADHVDVALSRVNLGSALLVRGRYADAEAELRRALPILEQGLGADHPSTSATRSNLGAVLMELAKYDEALVLHRQALAARERTLGPEHPETARSHNGIANVLQSQGHYAEALAEHRKARAIFEKTLGPDHPNVAGSHSNIGGCFFSMGENEAAAAEHRRAIEIFVKALGEDHEAVGRARTNLADVLLVLDRPQEALEQAEQAWARLRRGEVPIESEGLTAFALARALWLTGEDEASRTRALEMGAIAVEALTRAGPAYAANAERARTWLSERANWVP